MKLYHCRDSRSLRVLWTLEEMGLAYELEQLPFPPRVFKKDYLGINPLGTVPYFIDGETRMTESCAICHYLVERHDRAQFGLRPDEPDYDSFLNWLYHADATLTFPQTVMLRYRHIEPEPRRLSQAVEDYQGFFLGRLRLLDAVLADGREFLCAGRFTIADICIAYSLYLGSLPMLDIAPRYSPQARAWLERLIARPAFARASMLGEPLRLG